MSGYYLCIYQKSGELLKEHTYLLLLFACMWNTYCEKGESVCTYVKLPSEAILNFL